MPEASQRSIRVALISGGMYEGLYEDIPTFEREFGTRIEIAFRGSHPDLNAHLASHDPLGYDLVSTHTKYAPSQLSWLAPLNGLETELLGDDFFPRAVELARVQGGLYGVPRNLDVRLLHHRTDIIQAPPQTWDALLEEASRISRPPGFHGFVFCGIESGLFGTFYELAESAGARLFPDTLIPAVSNDGGRWALGLLRKLYASGAAPSALAAWRYEEVHSCFRGGHAAMVCDWPGYYGSYCDPSSPVRDRFDVARLPAGPEGSRKAYAGCHTFALTRAGISKPGAVGLLKFLTAPEQQRLEARQGSVPVRSSLMRELRQTAVEREAKRWLLLETVIQEDLIIPPKLSYYPRIEEILWRTVRAAMLGEIPIDAALAEIEKQIAACVREHSGHAA